MKEGDVDKVDDISISSLSRIVNNVEPNSLVIALIVKQMCKLNKFQEIVNFLGNVPQTLYTTASNVRNFDEIKKQSVGGSDLETQINTLMEVRNLSIYFYLYTYTYKHVYIVKEVWYFP